MTSPNHSPEHNHRRVGRFMGFIAWGMGLFLLYLFFQDQIQQQINPNQQPMSRQTGKMNEVVLKQNRAGHYVMSGFIDGTPVIFLLDTGATDVAIPESVACDLGLKPGYKYHVETANGTATAYQTEIQSLKIGTIKLTRMPAAIVPNMSGSEVLLGMSVLKQLEFTQRGNELILRQLR